MEEERVVGWEQQGGGNDEQQEKNGEKGLMEEKEGRME